MSHNTAPCLDTCGCCEPPAGITPLTLFNRPALSAITYRVGTYATFREAMIQAIPRLGAKLAAELGLPASPLARWTARQSDDYGIALLEIWATLGDILTFYQERIANEAYLGTAIQRDSLRRLAAMLDYKLNPGVAASTYLAFTLDKGATVGIPLGLRAQSVPKQGQTPQKFEAVEAINTNSELNQARVYPQPVADNPFGVGRTSGTLAATSIVPAPGDKLILFRRSGQPWLEPEEKAVEKVETVEGRDLLTWSPEVKSTGWSAETSQVFTFKRTFRLFGINAPAAYLKPETPTGTPPIITWEWLDSTASGSDYTFKLTATNSQSGTQLPLDGVYDDLKVKTRVLIRAPNVALLTTITAITQGPQTQGPIEGTVTVITLQDSIPGYSNIDRRNVRIYELGDEILFQGWATSVTIPTGTSTLYAPYPALSSISAKRVVILDDAADQPEPVTLTADGTTFTAPGAAQPDFIAFSFSPPLSRALETSTAYLLGNVAQATHGETVKNEALGNGDAAKAFQFFTLKKSPVTHRTSALAAGGALSTLSLLINQVAWKEVPSLYGKGRRDRVYTTEMDDGGKMTVRFGDGVTGARLSTGRKNVVATYRQGLGLAGNLDAGAISVALDRPTGLKSVLNPLPSSGGADPETTDEARSNAPNTVRTFDRAISLRDFEDLARGYAGIAKARATWVWDGEVQAVHLTVAGQNGANLSTDEIKTLKAYLDLRRDPNQPLLISGYVPTALQVVATLQIAPTYVNATVQAAAQAALEACFAFDNRQFGQAVHLSDVYAVLQSVEGAISVDVDLLGYKDPAVALAHGATAEPVQAHLRINQARANPAPPPKVIPAELAVIENPADISLTASGGLPS